MLVFALVGLKVPVRSMVLPGLIAYLSLFLYMALSRLPWLLSLPRIVDFLGLFVAGNLASMGEYITGTPSVLSIIPVSLMLAPGSHVVLAALQPVQVATESVEPFGDLVKQCVAYASGLVIALQIWKPLSR